MSKVDPKRLPKSRRDELTRGILLTFESLGLNEEGKMLLRGILTDSEIVMLARRLQIARRLICGDSFQCIASNLHVGLTTIRCVHDWLEDKFDDYRSFLVRFTGDGPSKRPLDSSAFQELKHRYPANYSLMNTLIGDPTKVLDEVYK
jgi:uncharacterized protein YerC